MTCRMTAPPARGDCLEYCGAGCSCDLGAAHRSDTIAFAATGAPPRTGDWMQTYTGRQYWPADPRPSEVDVRDIAHALSLQCRYGGHALRFYSVAEHCVLIARKMHGPRSLRLAALMHDASEAYLVDVPRPVKPQLRGYTEIEDRNMLAIAYQCGFDWPMPAEIKAADNAILHDERAQVMAPCAADWRLSGDPLGVDLQFWPPSIAESEFLREFDRLGGLS